MIKDYYFLKEKINQTIQNSGLDVGIVYFIFKDIFTNLETTYYAQINKELMEEQNNENNKSIEESV